MPGLQDAQEVLQLQVLDKGRLLCRRNDAGEEGSLLAQSVKEPVRMPVVVKGKDIMEEAHGVLFVVMFA